MIARIKGKLIMKAPDHLIVDVNGVGYRVYTPLSTYCALPDLGGTLSLHIHTHVREDTFKLFGFLSTHEQALFEKLISVSKIGPKLALAILSGIPAGELERAVMESDVQRLGSIPGVGKKTAERLALELRDKLKPLTSILGAQTGFSVKGGPDQNLFSDALSALINLGFAREKAEKAISKVNSGDKDKKWAIEELIKEALKVLV